jgi:ABC-2 type transport system permease protein
MRRIATIAGVELRRFLRDRSNIFFVFIFPLLLVLVVGAQFGGGGGPGRVAVAGEDSALRQDLVTALEQRNLEVGLADRDAALEQAARGRVGAAVLVPDGASEAYDAGGEVTLEVVPSSSATGLVVEQVVRTAVEGLSLERAQLQALTSRGVAAAEAGTALESARADAAPPELRITDVDEIAQEFSGLGQFDLGATSQLLLFVFLISTAASNTLIQARREGVIARTMAAPVTPVQALAGQAAGRWVICMFQGGYIMLATFLLFDVDWGSPLLALLVLAMFGAVAAGAALLLGALLDNEAAASGVGVGLGLVLAGIGGGMLPLELFSDTLRTVAHVTPHAWAYEAYAELQRHDGGLVDILPQLGVLAAMAAVVLALGAWALRRSLERAM